MTPEECLAHEDRLIERARSGEPVWVDGEQKWVWVDAGIYDQPPSKSGVQVSDRAKRATFEPPRPPFTPLTRDQAGRAWAGGLPVRHKDGRQFSRLRSLPDESPDDPQWARVERSGTPGEAIVLLADLAPDGWS